MRQYMAMCYVVPMFNLSSQVERTEHFNLLMQACYNEDYEDIREQRVKDIHEALEMFMTENKGKIPSKDKSELVPVERYRLA